MGVLLNYKNWKRLYETALSIDTPAESLAGRLLRSALAVLIRESSW